MKIKKRIIYLTLAMTICLTSNYYCYTQENEYDGVIQDYTDSEGNTCELWIRNDGHLDYVVKIKEGTVLKELIIPDCVKRAGTYGIDYARVEKIYFHAGIEDMIFGFNEANEFIVDENNPVYRSENGVVYSKDMKVLEGYPVYKEEMTFLIPDTVEKIDFRFMETKFLENIIFPSSLKEFDLNYIPYENNLYIPPEIDCISEDNWNEYIERYMRQIQNNSDSPNKVPKVIYTEEDSPYMEMFNSNEMWLPVTGEENYDMRHVNMALKMSLKLYDTQMDLWEYANNGNSKVLFDENGNEEVDLDDVKVVLRKALKIE